MARLLLIGVLGLSVGACSEFRNPVVARVGDFTITAQDVARRNKVLRIYQPQDDRDLGLDQLVRFYKTAQILRNNGQKLDDAELSKESARIDKTTLMPEMLAQIKSVFTEEGRFDRESYLKTFVLPQYAERIIYFEYFLNDPERQKDSLARAKDFISRAQAHPGGVEAVAKLDGFTPVRFRVAGGEVVWNRPEPPTPAPALGEKGDKRPAPPAAPPSIAQKVERDRKERESSESLAWRRVGEQLKAGQIFSEVINYGERWIVVQLLKTRGGAKDPVYEMTSVELPKSDYGKWLAAEDAKVAVKYLQKR